MSRALTSIFCGEPAPDICLKHLTEPDESRSRSQACIIQTTNRTCNWELTGSILRLQISGKCVSRQGLEP